MTGKKWISTKFKGVRYYEHPTRNQNERAIKKVKDRYLAIRYQSNGKRIEEGIGWTSKKDPEDDQFWTEEKAALILERLKGAAKFGKKEAPTRIAEQRAIERRRKEAEEKRLKEEKEEKALAEKQNITFGDFVKETYFPQCKADKKKRTYVNEEVIYRLHLANPLANLSFKDISPFHLERVKKDMADKKMSDRSVQYALQLTRQVFNMARKEGIFTGESPTSAVKWPKPDNMKLRYLSIDEAERLLAALAVKSKNLHDIALLSLFSGLRFGEAAALTWSCYNEDAGTLTILNAKTGSRTAYLTDRAKSMLNFRKQSRKSAGDLIFPKRSGKEGIMTEASKVFADTVKELGLNDGVSDRKQKVTFHTLRHSFATHLYESTHDLYLTQRSLGHATGTMTARYAKMSESRLREGAAALEKAFAEKARADGGQVVNFQK